MPPQLQANVPAPVQAPAPAPGSSPTSAAGQRQASVGNAAVAGALGAGSTIGAQIPEQLDLQSAGLSFQLPGNTALTGDWNQLETTSRTGVYITLSPQSLQVVFSPPLVVDAQWPASNVAWSGFTWDFGRAALTRVDLESTQIGFSVAGTVHDAVAAFVQQIVGSSTLSKPGYNPLSDPNVAGTLAKLQSNFQGRPATGKPGNLKAGDVTGFALSAEATTRREIRAGAGSGGIVLPAGASLSLSASLAGTGADIGSRSPEVQALYFSSSNLTLESGGKPVAKLRSLRVDRGGTVDVTDFEPLGKLAEIGAGESLIRLFGLLAVVQGGADPRLAGNGDISPRIVGGIAEKQMEESLTTAVQQLVRDHHDVVPGLDLRSVLGVAAPKQKS